MSPQNDSIPAARRLIEAAQHILTETNPDPSPRSDDDGNLTRTGPSRTAGILGVILRDLADIEKDQAEDDRVREWLSARYDRKFVGSVSPKDVESYRRSKAFWEKHLAQVAQATPPAAVDQGKPHLAVEIIGETAPEPDRSTRWIASNDEGTRIHFDGTYWQIAESRFAWNNIPSPLFPLRRDFDAEALAQTEEAGPRVIEHGDPEPDHRTKWVDDDGIRWAHTYDGWINSPRDEEGVEWSSIHPDHFPMTEV